MRSLVDNDRSGVGYALERAAGRVVRRVANQPITGTANACGRTVTFAADASGC